MDGKGDVFVTGQANYTVYSKKGTASTEYLFGTWELAKGSSAFQQIDLDTSTTAGTGYGVMVDESGAVYATGYDYLIPRNGMNSFPQWTIRKGTYSSGKWTFATVDQVMGTSYGGVSGGATGLLTTPNGVYATGRVGNDWIIRKSATGASGTWTTVDSINTGALGSQAMGIAVDAAGNFYAAGYLSFMTPSGATTDNWVVRESSNGGLSWVTVDNSASWPLYAADSNDAVAIGRDPAGNIYVAGRVRDTVEHALVRTNAGGTWSTIDDYTTAEYASFAADTFGNLYAGGQQQSPSGMIWTIRSLPTSAKNLAAAADAANPSSQINLSWANSAGGDETGFAIYRSSDGINFTLVATVDAATTSYSDSGLSAATTYSYYVVTLLNYDGFSAPSNTATATTLVA